MDIKDEIKSTCESNRADTTAEIIIKDIFDGCDPEGKGSVRVSDLVNFIKPYFESCPDDLVELSLILDPHSQNQEITNTDFLDKMSKWMEKYGGGFSNSSEHGVNRSPQALLNFGTPSKHKHNLVEKMKTMDGDMNESFASNISVTESGGNKSFLEERINELNYQNKKCGDELSYAKSQLSASEELIESLQKSNEDYKRKLSSIKEMYDSLQKQYQQCDNFREITNNNQQQMEKLAKRVSLIEKENSNLKHLNSSLEIEKQQFDQKLALCQKKLMASEQETLALQMEVAIKDKRLIELEDVKHDLQRKLNETTRISNEYKEIYESTLSEKKLLQTELECVTRDISRSHSTTYSEYQSCLDSFDTTNTSTEDVLFVPAINTNRFHFYNFDSPYARRRSRSHRASLPTRLTYQNDTETDCNKSLISEGNGSLARVCTTDEDARQKPGDMASLPNDSYSDDDISMHLTNAKFSPHESLHDELSKAAAQESSYQCDHNSDQHTLQFKINTDNMVTQFNDLKSEYDQLEHEKTKLETMIVENNNKVKQLSTCLEKIQKEHAVEIQGLIKERDQLELQITQIENEKLKAEENWKEASGRLEIILEDNRYLQGVLQTQITDTNILRDKVERLDRNSLDLAKENKHLDLTIRMQTEILRTKEMTFELETQELSSRLERMKYEQSKLKLDLSQLEEADMHNRDLICRYEKQVEKISQELSNVNLALEMKENDHKFCKDMFEDKIRSYKQKVAELQGCNLQLQDINNKLELKCKDLEPPCDFLLPLSMADSCTSTSSSGDDNVGLPLVLSESAVLCKKILEIEQHYNRCKHHCSFNLLQDISCLKNSLIQSEVVRKLGKTQRSGFDRMKIKFERLQEKVDYLEEKLAQQRQRSFQLEEEKRCLEAKQAVVSQDTYHDLFESGRLLQRATDNLIQRWNQHDQHIMTTAMGPGHVTDEGDYNSSNDNVLNTKLYFLNKKMLYSITAMNNIVELAASSFDSSGAPEEGFVFPPTSDKLTLRLPHLASRPMSPDSPNLEVKHISSIVNVPSAQTKTNSEIAHGPDSTIETMTIQSYIGAGDFSGDSNLNDTNSTIFEDACVDISVSMIHAFDQLPNDEMWRQELTEEELEQKFQEFVLEFIIDKSTIDKRVDVQCTKLRQLEVELASTVNTLMTILSQCLNGDHLKRAQELVEHLQRKNCHLTRLVEQLGGIKFERKKMYSTNITINYMSVLRKKLDEVNQKRPRYTSLHSETVLMEEVIKHNISASIPMPRHRLDGLRKCLHPTKLFGMFCTMGAFCCVLCVLMQCFNMVTDHRPGTMWRSLEDSVWPLLRKEYRNGPPPT